MGSKAAFVVRCALILSGPEACHAPARTAPEPTEVDMAVEANLDAFLDKEWESKSLAEVLKAPVSALQGVS